MKRVALLTIVAVLFLNGEGTAQEKKALKYKRKTAAEWIPLLADEKEWHLACQALQKLGPEAQKEAIPLLLEMLEDRSGEMRGIACCCLREFADHAEPAVPSLLALLVDSEKTANGYVRSTAAYALCAIKLDAHKVMPALLRHLEDRDAEIARLACCVLASMGPAAKDAVGPLMKTMQRNDQKLREYAIDALGKIGPASAPALPLIVKTMRDPKLKFERLCLEALENIGPASTNALIDSWDLVAGENGATILRALGKFGPEAKQALPLLEKSLADQRRDCRREAAIAIWRIEKRKQIVPVLLGMLEYVEPNGADPAKKHVDDAVCSMLGELGKDAVPALATLERLLAEAKHDYEKYHYLTIIRAIDPDVAQRIGADLPEAIRNYKPPADSF